MSYRAQRSTRYFSGIGKGRREGSGRFVWDPEKREFVKVSERSNVASATCIEGEPVVCDAGGETLDMPTGPVTVADATEKRRVLREHGLMPAPTGMGEKPAPDPGTLQSFGDFFREQHGVALSEATGLIHERKR